MEKITQSKETATFAHILQGCRAIFSKKNMRLSIIQKLEFRDFRAEKETTYYETKKEIHLMM